MKIHEYETKEMSFRLPSADSTYAVLNLAAEVGELYSHIAKAIRDGVEDEEAHFGLLHKELGDILWQVTAIARDTGSSLEQIANKNLDKLSKRRDNNSIKGSGDNR